MRTARWSCCAAAAVAALATSLHAAATGPAASKFLQDVKARAGEKSLLGKMAAEFLAM